jgi:hypothetical protein
VQRGLLKENPCGVRLSKLDQVSAWNSPLRDSADCPVHVATQNGRSANACTDTVPKNGSLSSLHRQALVTNRQTLRMRVVQVLTILFTRLGVREGSECDLYIRCRALRRLINCSFEELASMSKRKQTLMENSCIMDSVRALVLCNDLLCYLVLWSRRSSRKVRVTVGRSEHSQVTMR